MSTEATVRDVLDESQLLNVLVAVRNGDFTGRMPVEHTGIAGKIADALNDIIELNQRMAKEFGRISVAVGKEGKTSQRTAVSGANGGWATYVDSVNTLISDLVQPTNETARVIGAVNSAGSAFVGGWHRLGRRGGRRDPLQPATPTPCAP